MNRKKFFLRFIYLREGESMRLGGWRERERERARALRLPAELEPDMGLNPRILRS